MEPMTLPDRSYRHNEAGLDPLLDAYLDKRLPLDLGRRNLLPEAFTDLGHFGTLPIEILLMILEELPIISLIRFRNTNRLARHIIDTMPAFRIIVEQAPQAIRGVVAVQINNQVSLPSLLEKLRQRNCDNCGKLAQHLWLPTTSRLCFGCARFGLSPFGREETKKRFSLTDEDLEFVPRFRYRPTTFSSGPKGNTFRVPTEHVFYDAKIATELCYQKTGLSVPKISDWREDPLVIRFVRNFEYQNLPIDFPPYLVPQYGRRNMATIVAPWITKDGPVTGVYCGPCLYTENEDTVYTPVDFATHIQDCRSRPGDEKFARYMVSYCRCKRLRLVES